MTQSTNIFLIGPMGAGKTSIGKHLARALGLVFVDADHEIEALTGVDIPWIFDVEGEAGFRRYESQIIASLTQKTGIVLATGGGVVLCAENRAHLAERGVVVYLKASIDALVKRTSQGSNRPLIPKSDPREALERLIAEREAFYLELADVVYETEGRSVAAMVQAMVKDLHKRHLF